MNTCDHPETYNKRVIFAASLMSAAGATIFLIMPLLIGIATEDLGLSSERSGFLASSYFAGYLLICLSAVFWIHKVHWQLVSASGYIALIAGLLFSALGESYALILIAFFISGCGGGILFGLCLCILAETNDPDRYFGVKITAEQLLAAALLFLLPKYVTATWGFLGLAIVVSLVFLLLSLSTLWVPARGIKQAVKASGSDTKYSTLPIWIGLCCLMVFMAGLSGVWAFIERMANDNGIDAIAIGKALSFGVIGGGIGGFAAAMIGDKFGRSPPLVFSLVILAAALFMLNDEFSELTFALSCFALSGLWNYSLAYQMGIVAKVDAGGKLTILMSSALSLGAMLGPAVAGLVIKGQDYYYVHLIAVVCILVTTVIFIRLSTSTDSSKVAPRAIQPAQAEPPNY